MPYKSEKITISGSRHDRRRKLTEGQKQEIRENKMGLSQRKLAAVYGVSRRTITFILDPEKLAENLKRRQERGGHKQYYDKEKHAHYMQNHRKYKQDLYVKGKIQVMDESKQAIEELSEALYFCRSVIISNGVFERSEQIAVDKATKALKKHKHPKIS